MSPPQTAHDQALRLQQPALAPAGGELRLVERLDAPRDRGLASRLLEGRGWTRLRFASDALVACLSMVAAHVGAPVISSASGSRTLLVVYVPLLLGVMALRGVYERDRRAPVLDECRQVLSAASLAAMSLIAFIAFVAPSGGGSALVVRAWVFAVAYVAGARCVLALTRHHARATRVIGKPTLIVGAGHVGTAVERRLRECPEIGLVPIGFVDADPLSAEELPEREGEVYAAGGSLAGLVAETGAEHLILAFSSEPDRVLIPLIREADELGLEVSVVPRLFESTTDRTVLEHIGGLPLFSIRRVNPKGWQFALKHVFDCSVAALLLLLSAPLTLGIALATRLSSPGPVLFRQPRIGRDGRQFDILKFRSMRMADPQRALGDALAASRGTAPGGVEGDDRRTRIGTLLRKTSLDELPQLLNVLKGEMSLIGPRPERTEFVELFGESIRRYDDRHRVKSGITGWAQVHGLRGKTSLEDRVEWDNFYIENWSLWLDFKILLMTGLAVLKGAE